MTEGKRVAFAGAEIPPQLKQSYAEVENFLRLGKLDLLYCKVNEQKVEGDFKMLSADTTLTSFLIIVRKKVVWVRYSVSRGRWH